MRLLNRISGTCEKRRIYPKFRAENGAKIFMIISTVVLGFYLIPLAWCIPMTISYFKKVQNNEPVSTGFKVCSLLFVNTVAGILMLCDKD